MKTIKLLLPMFFMLNLFSCSPSYEIVDKSQLKTTFTLHSSPTFKGFFYQGTDHDFHYFISRWKLAKYKYFKVKKEDFNVNSSYAFGTKEVRIDVFDTGQLFGSNEFMTLYVIE